MGNQQAGLDKCGQVSGSRAFVDLGRFDVPEPLIAFRPRAASYNTSNMRSGSLSAAMVSLTSAPSTDAS